MHYKRTGLSKKKKPLNEVEMRQEQNQRETWVSYGYNQEEKW